MTEAHCSICKKLRPATIIFALAECVVMVLAVAAVAISARRWHLSHGETILFCLLGAVVALVASRILQPTVAPWGGLCRTCRERAAGKVLP